MQGGRGRSGGEGVSHWASKRSVGRLETAGEEATRCPGCYLSSWGPHCSPGGWRSSQVTWVQVVRLTSNSEPLESCACRTDCLLSAHPPNSAFAVVSADGPDPRLERARRSVRRWRCAPRQRHPAGRGPGGGALDPLAQPQRSGRN